MSMTVVVWYCDQCGSQGLSNYSDELPLGWVRMDAEELNPSGLPVGFMCRRCVTYWGAKR